MEINNLQIEIMPRKSEWRKWKDGDISRTDYNNFLARQNGFKDANDEVNHWIASKGLDRNGYNDYKARKNGFKNHSDRSMQWRYRTGRSKPGKEFKEHANYLGIHIAEQLLPKIYEYVTRMPNCNEGYDFICGKGFKIDVKSSCLHKKRNCWTFSIRRNKIADYFLMIAFDDRYSLNPLHIYLIKGTEIINNNSVIKKQVCEKQAVTIFNNNKILNIYKQYEQTDKLDKIISCCNEFKQHNNGDLK